MKQEKLTTKVRRYLCNKLGGEIKEDYIKEKHFVIHHDRVQYDRFVYTMVVDGRLEVPKDILKNNLLRQLSTIIKPYVTFTENRNRYAPYQEELRAEIWVGK